MTGNKSKNKAFFLSSVILLFALPLPCQGATFCVSDANTLRNTLIIAGSNGEEDVVQIVQGIYWGNFVYPGVESKNLSILGGFTQNCSSRQIDPTNTVLDGADIELVLSIVNNSEEPSDFLLEGVTLTNGTRMNSQYALHGGGLYVNIPALGSSLTLNKNIITNNSLRGGNDTGGGAYIEGSEHTLITLTDNIFESNKASNSANLEIKTNSVQVRVDNKWVPQNNSVVSLEGNQFLSGDVNYIAGGANVNCPAGRVIVSGNSFVDNEDLGLSISASKGQVTLANNTFNSNVRGASIRSGHISNITGNTFQNNVTNYTLYSSGAFSLTTNVLHTDSYIINFNNNTFLNNYFSGRHGGWGIAITGYQAEGTFNIENNYFENNISQFSGGLFLQAGGSSYGQQAYNIFNNQFINNTSQSNGGGLCFAGFGGTSIFNTSIAIAGNIFSGNSATQDGGGLYVVLNETNYNPGNHFSLSNNTFYGNSADSGAGFALSMGDDELDKAQIYNNIFWLNVATTISHDLFINNDTDNDFFPVPVEMKNNNFNQEYPTYFWSKIPIIEDNSNLDGLDPLFLDAENNDFHLAETSPMINVGNNQAPGLPALDYDGDRRRIGGKVDIGADESIYSSSNINAVLYLLLMSDPEE